MKRPFLALGPCAVACNASSGSAELDVPETYVSESRFERCRT